MNPFDWRSSPSEIAETLKPHRMARNQSQLEPRRLFTINQRKAEVLRERFGGAYSKATPKESNDVL